MYIRKICLIAVCSLLLSVAKAQLPKAEMTAAISEMSLLIKEHYVHPQKGVAIAGHLQQAYNTGQFAAAKSWKDFSQRVTTSLQHFSHDGHLYVRYDTARSRELLISKNEKEQKVKDGGSDTDKKNKMEEGPDPFFYGPAAADYNYGFESVRVSKDNIGYLRLTEINISRKSLPTLYAAMDFVAHTKALVIDLRNNGGGGSDTGAVLESYFLPANTPLLTFSSRTGHQSTDSTVSWLKAPHYNGSVFILINKKTASAAEAFTFVMQKTGRAIIIGERSAGAANMNAWFAVNQHIFLSVSEMAPVWHDTDETWEQRGVQPDCPARTEQEINACIKKG